MIFTTKWLKRMNPKYYQRKEPEILSKKCVCGAAILKMLVNVITTEFANPLFIAGFTASAPVNTPAHSTQCTAHNLFAF